MKKFNNYMRVGLILNSIFLFANGVDLFPEFVKGVCMALGITLIFIGIYSEKHDVSRLKNYKKALFNRVLSK